MTMNVTGKYELEPLVTVAVHPEISLIQLTVAKYAFTAKTVAVTDHKGALEHRGEFASSENYTHKKDRFLRRLVASGNEIYQGKIGALREYSWSMCTADLRPIQAC